MKSNRGSEWRRWDLHVHTAASKDYQYKAPDADELLVKAWEENNIEVVAITDHFIIDAERIKKIRKIAPNMTIFPGVELRTDKGSTNIHVNLIFSDKINVDELSQDFESIMLREKEKSYDFQDIFWDYNEIVSFAERYKGIISIHAGNKSNGLDDQISNSDLFKMAVKKDYSKTVNIFEVSNLKSFDEYQKIVLPQIGERPVIICSDNHNPEKYHYSEALWVKADKTYEGLLQAIEHPRERIYVGNLPAKLEHEKRDKQYILDSIEITKNDKVGNDNQWFDTELPLNSSLVSIVGNKGTGKSALSDILGLLGNSDNFTEDYSSFLTKDRFNKSPEKYGKYYNAKIKWKDNHEKKVENLYSPQNDESQTVQYLPQKYIEKVCTELGDNFQQEINKVLFSYISVDDRLGTNSFEDFIRKKTERFEISITNKIDNLKEINKQIISLEELLKESYLINLQKLRQEKIKELEREEKLKPEKVEKPENFDNSENSEITNISEEMKKLKKVINNKKTCFTKLKTKVNDIETLKTELDLEVKRIKDINNRIDEMFSDEKDNLDLHISVNIPMKNINNILDDIRNNISLLDEELNNEDNGLEKQYSNLESSKAKLSEETTKEIQAYHSYIKNLNLWKDRVYEIKNNKENNESLLSINEKIDYIETELKDDYIELQTNRRDIINEIFNEKKETVKTYMEIYKPVDKELRYLLDKLDNNIAFSASLTIDDNALSNLLQDLNKQYKSLFQGTDNANSQLRKLVNDLDPNDLDSIFDFTEKFWKGCMQTDKKETFDNLSKVIKDKESLYEELFGLNYIDVDYSITLEEKELTQLSPGERGLVLLIFYLVLSQDKKPIVIDQPEDNLDNQSVFSKLVPCIKEAKKNRQVILVTHNPNIAVACDSEQIIIAEMDKIKNEITYNSGSIEDKKTNNKLVDILEGTQPAFDLRGRKYILEKR